MLRSSIIIVLGLVVLAALVALVVLVVGPHLIIRDRPATIADVSGTVLFKPARDSQWITARVGMPLRRGDQLLTVPPIGRAIVHLDDGSVGFSLEPDSLLTLTASWNVLQQTASNGVYLSHGSLFAIAQKEMPKALTRFHVDTETADVAIESTWLAVQVLKDEPTTRVSSLEGDVRVHAKLDNAVLYSPDAQRLTVREAVLSNNQTLLVHVESPNTRKSTLRSRLGRVVDAESGIGKEGVVVDVVGSPELFAITEADGYFAIDEAPASSELMVVGATEGVQSDLELRLDVGQATGRVINSMTGQGIAKARVIPIEHPALATETGLDGSFTIDELPLGTHSLSIVVGGYTSTAAEITMEAQVLVSIPDILLLPERAIEDQFLPVIFKSYRQYP